MNQLMWFSWIVIYFRVLCRFSMLFGCLCEMFLWYISVRHRCYLVAYMLRAEEGIVPLVVDCVVLCVL